MADDDEKQNKSSFKGGVQALADVLKLSAKKHGKKFCSYKNNDDVKKAPIDEKKLESKVELLRSLRKLQHNYSFKKTDVEKALKLVFKAFHRISKHARA